MCICAHEHIHTPACVQVGMRGMCMHMDVNLCACVHESVIRYELEKQAEVRWGKVPEATEEV